MTQNTTISSGVAPPVLRREAALRPSPPDSADFVALLDTMPMQTRVMTDTVATGSQPDGDMLVLPLEGRPDLGTDPSLKGALADDLSAETVADPGYALLALPLDIRRLSAEAQVAIRGGSSAAMHIDVSLAQPGTAADAFAPANPASPTVGETALIPQLSDAATLPATSQRFDVAILDNADRQVGSAQPQSTAGISQDQPAKIATDVLLPGQLQNPIQSASPDFQAGAASIVQADAHIETTPARQAAGQDKYPLLDSVRPAVLTKDDAPSMPTQATMSERAETHIGQIRAASPDHSVARPDRQWPAERPFSAFPAAKEAAYRHGAALAAIGLDPVATQHLQDLGSTDLPADSGPLAPQATLVAKNEEAVFPTRGLSSASISALPVADLSSLPQTAYPQPQQFDGFPADAAALAPREAAFMAPSAENARPSVIAHVSIADLPRVLTAAARSDQPQSMSLQLDPVELGSLAFNMEQGPAGLVVNIVAERPETLDLLRRHADQFLADLRHSGYQGVNLQFSQSDHSGGQRQASSPMMPDNAQPTEQSIDRPAVPLPTQRQTPALGLDLRL